MAISWPIGASTGSTYTYAGNEWVYTGSAWRTVGASVPGPVGASGSTGSIGPEGPTGPTGPAGGMIFTYEIGEYAPSEGGVIIHRWLTNGGVISPGTEENYLVMTIDDVSSAAPWGFDNVDVIGAESFTDGASNTAALVSNLGITPADAAYLCDNYTDPLAGKTDWYLPAFFEISFLGQNYWAVSQGISLGGGTLPTLYGVYWSSTENGTKNAYAASLLYDINDFKISTYAVRAVRKFTI